jgi:hypothetical protein
LNFIKQGKQFLIAVECFPLRKLAVRNDAAAKLHGLRLAQPVQRPNDKIYGLRNPRNYQMVRFATCAARATTKSHDSLLAETTANPKITNLQCIIVVVHCQLSIARQFMEGSKKKLVR